MGMGVLYKGMNTRRRGSRWGQLHSYSLSTLPSFPVQSSDKGGKLTLGCEDSSDQPTAHKRNWTLPSAPLRQDSTVKSEGSIDHKSGFM